jgi:hypothetical protein
MIVIELKPLTLGKGRDQFGAGKDKLQHATQQDSEIT